MQKKYSLHVGLNNIDKTKYKGNYNTLRNAENDTNYYYSLAQSIGFDAVILAGPDAIADNLITNIISIAKKMVAGDLFFLTYSGHGSRVKDLNGDEPDGIDEILVLYDRFFIDDEFQKYWLLFPENSGVFFVNDSCFNGTVSRFFEINRDFLNAVMPEHLFRGVDASVTEIDFENNIDVYKEIKVPPADSLPLCSIIHIAACQDNQLADDGFTGMDNGYFTSMFKELYNNGAFKENYKIFFDELQAIMPPYQSPNWDTEAGADTTIFQTKQLFEI